MIIISWPCLISSSYATRQIIYSTNFFFSFFYVLEEKTRTDSLSFSTECWSLWVDKCIKTMGSMNWQVIGLAMQPEYRDWLYRIGRSGRGDVVRLESNFNSSEGKWHEWTKPRRFIQERHEKAVNRAFLGVTPQTRAIRPYDSLGVNLLPSFRWYNFFPYESLYTEIPPGIPRPERSEPGGSGGDPQERSTYFLSLASRALADVCIRRPELTGTHKH